jgi:5-methylcytosine-specific restriction endonuclease McrA
MRSSGLVLVDRKRNAIAYQLLRKFSKGVDELREHINSVRTPPAVNRSYSDYLQTVLGSTDTIGNRERRRDILKELLWSLFERKDDKRKFTPEQRRIIWGTDQQKICAHCREPLSWDDFTADHILAFAKGGKTATKNAQAMHRRCNSSKGAR